jgi:glycosyltransferase involved in cell wall biosynthesis
MVNEPSLSVVTIGLNNLSGYQRTCASLGRQSRTNIQHIIVDGSSNDGSQEWLQTHRVASDTLVISEPDAGIYDAMNKGLARAHGSLVCFMNAGDRFGHSSVIEEVLASYEVAPWQWAFGRAQVEDATGQAVTRVHRERYAWWRQTFWHYTICHQAVFMETEFLRGLGGFSTDLAVSADYELMVKAGLAAKPHVFDDVFARILEGGLSGTRPRQTRMEGHLARSRVLEFNSGRQRIDRTWQRAVNLKSDAKAWVRATIRRFA